MGDRGNIAIIQHTWIPDTEGGGMTVPTGAIFFYGHWSGYRLEQSLAEGLERGRSGWGDEPYLARIIFDTFTSGGDNPLLGFGISTYLTDNEYPVLLVDDSKGVVYTISRQVADRLARSFLPTLTEILIYDKGEPYEEFIARVKGV